MIQKYCSCCGAYLFKIAERKLFWHGTSPKNLRSILKQGLLPDVKDKVYTEEIPSDDRYRSLKTYGGIYLARNWRTAYSSAGTAGNNKHRLIIGVTLETRSPDTGVDEDYILPILERALGFGHDNIYYNPDIQSHILMEDYFSSNSKFKLNYARLPEVVKSIKDLTLSKSTDKVLTQLQYNQPLLTKRLGKDVKKYSYLINEALLALIFHRMEISYVKEKSKVISYIEERLQSLDKDYSKKTDQSYKEELFKNYTRQLSILKNPPVEITNTWSKLKDIIDKLTKALPELSTPTKEEDSFHTIRSWKPIGFSGKNRILTIVEIDETTTPYTLIVHYGKNNVQDFINNFTESIDKDYIIK